MTGPELRAARIGLGLTQEALADAMGYGGTAQSRKSMVSEMELSKAPVSSRAFYAVQFLVLKAASSTNAAP
jgi:transcriptional regulator with XRE-family HTH domain